jgi:surfeit locus 1 family protein
MTVGRFHSSWVLLVTVILALAILIGLGTWQAQKIGPKSALIERIENGLSAEAIPLPIHMDDPQSMAYRRVYFDGIASDIPPIKVVGTNLKGNSGFYLYKPVVKDFGMAVMVNFGWVPFHLKQMPALPVGAVRIEGVLMINPVAGSFTPENQSDTGAWYLADVHQMAEYFGLISKEYYPFRVFADGSTEPRALPLGGQVRIDIPNDHFQYMLTWYGLGASLLGVFIVFGFKKPEE